MISKSLSNYEKAKAEADRIDELIISTLQSGNNFRVEAGAGSGKTYSLNKVIEWIQNNRWSYYKNQKQNVICITYTNAAVDVISNRLQDKSFIIPSTIHAFAWSAIKQYQSFLVTTVKNDESYHPREGDIQDITNVQYDLGHRLIKEHTLYLYHDDVISLFSRLLDNNKFRNIFTKKYPLILIDEYQDSFESIISRFLHHFISQNTGPQFGFFGDSWQTIYQSQKACGEIVDDNIIQIKKVSNFRSAPRIVEMLNLIRPDLPQISAIDSFNGDVTVVTCNDYTGVRRDDRNFKGDLPVEELRNRLEQLCSTVKSALIDANDSIKTLMITHKVLASQQGYDQLLSAIGDRLKDKEDPIIIYFMEKVEPIFKALQTFDMPLLFDILGVKKYPITKKSQKKQWQDFEQQLILDRQKTAFDVLKTVCETGLIPVPKKIEEACSNYIKQPDQPYENITLKEYLNINYSQFLSAIGFLYPEAEFSTEHGVKGEEYDNVIFSITKGWNQYQFDLYAPMIINGKVPKDKDASFIRNRNLFYVCCSRPKKRLIIFVTLEVDSIFESFLKKLSGKNNYYDFQQYINNLNQQNQNEKSR